MEIIRYILYRKIDGSVTAPFDASKTKNNPNIINTLGFGSIASKATQQKISNMYEKKL